MANLQARLKPEHRLRYPGLNAVSWYDVAPLYPGLRERALNMSGERITRLRTRHEYVTVLAAHLEFRPAVAEHPSVSATATA